MKKIIKNISEIRLIIFDLDGTLYNRSIYLAKYYDFSIAALQDLVYLSKIDAEKLLNDNMIFPKAYTANSSVTDLFLKIGVPLNVWNEYRNTYFDISPNIRRNKKIVHVMNCLKERHKLVLVTNNTQFMTDKIINKIGINRDDFDLIITSEFKDQIKMVKKEIFQYISALYKIDYNRILSIGDRYEVDIKPMIELGGNGLLISTPKEVIDFFNNCAL